ncbi:porin [Citrobacter meridianamericanus]|uniref:Porin n=1 Tax=Citrobacter meridianamericanus TaxID=2894201 RepID=A0ABT1BFI1_9ENTR|nr:porin [Citrobacter meridianamericanus]MCO5784620.1 porin [Citrobacter meridianamericanus]
MKKKLIAVVVVSLLAAGAANAAEIYNKSGNKVDLYGKVKGEFDINSNDDRSDATYARLGFRGETQITEAVTGFGQWEYQANASGPEGAQSEKTRLAFAGIKLGDAGSLDYGRNYGVVYDIGAYADNLTEFGGDSYQTTDNYMTGRSTGLLTYRTSDAWGMVDGLAFALQYQSANENRDWKTSNGEGVGTSLQYTIPDSGVTLGAAYANAKTSDATDSFGYKIAQGEHAEVWTLGAKYDANALYLAATYAETRNMTPLTLKNAFASGTDAIAFVDKTENLELMAAYAFDNGFRPSLGYVQSRADIGGFSEWVQKYIQAGVGYNFNKNFMVDAGYKINLLNDDLSNYGINSDDQVVFGVTYQF